MPLLWTIVALLTRCVEGRPIVEHHVLVQVWSIASQFSQWRSLGWAVSFLPLFSPNEL